MSVIDYRVSVCRSIWDRHPRRYLAAFALLFLGTTMVAAATERNAVPKPAEPAPQLYRDLCLDCHRSDGRGAAMRKAMPKIPDFTDRKWQHTRNDADLQHSILEGKGPFMEALKDDLTPEDARQLVAYVRNFVADVPAASTEQLVLKPTLPEAKETMTASAESPKAASAATNTGRHPPVATAYRQYCARCHGADGTGAVVRDAMPTVPDFANKNWQLRHTAGQLRASIQDGKGQLMPAFGDKLDGQGAQELVAHLRQFAPSDQKPSATGASSLQREFNALQQQLEELERQRRELASQAAGS